MLDKVQYGDYNRFLASIGLVLIALGLLLPYFYLKENFDLLIKNEDLNALTDVARGIITTRQNYTQQLITIIPIASSLSILSGIILLIIGLRNWKRRQNIEDDKTLQERDKIIAEMAKIRAETDKIIKEGKKIPLQEVIENKNKEIQKTEPDISERERKGIVSKYLLVEALVAEKFKREYSDQYNVLVNYKVNNREFDIILSAINEDTKKRFNFKKDVIVEVKYTRKINKQIVNQAIQQTGELIKAYPNAFTNPIVLFVMEEPVTNVDKDELLSKIISEWSEKTVSKWNIKFIQVDELPDIRLKDLLGI